MTAKPSCFRKRSARLLGTLLCSLLVQRRIYWCFSVLSVWKPLKCSKQINDFCSLICHFFVTALLRDQRGKSSRNPVKYLGDLSVWERSQREGRRLGLRGWSNPQIIMNMCYKVEVNEVNTSDMCTPQEQGAVVTCCNKRIFLLDIRRKNCSESD